MLRFEVKKIFSKTANKIAFLVLTAALVIVSILTINRVEYVDENGKSSTGIVAARNLRNVKNQWAGLVTEEVLTKVIEENVSINQSEEALSEDIEEQDKAYSKKQGIMGIVDIINNAFSEWRDYDYYAVDNVSAEEAKNVYAKRVATLKEWLDSGEEKFTDTQKEFLIGQYEALKTPFYYEYVDGWSALLQNISTFLLILALVIGFFVSGIFSDEFQTKADAIFFSTRLGRNRAVLSKIGAGFLITTGFYIIFVILYTLIVLLALGADGAGCPIQLDMWRSIYNITFFQAYLLIVAGGYVGTLFASLAAMIVSAATRSTAAAIIMPFIVLCALPFLSRIITLPQICSLFPDQLLEIYIALKDFALVELGGKVTDIVSVLIPAYLIVCVLLHPVLYEIYKRTEVR